MSEELIQQIALLISNTIRVLAFIGLAMFFGKWWIALLSALFLTYTKEEDSNGE